MMNATKETNQDLLKLNKDSTPDGGDYMFDEVEDKIEKLPKKRKAKVEKKAKDLIEREEKKEEKGSK